MTSQYLHDTYRYLYLNDNYSHMYRDSSLTIFIISKYFTGRDIATLQAIKQKAYKVPVGYFRHVY